MFAQNVVLDPSFGVGGKVLTTYSDTNGGVIVATQTQTNGKIIALGKLPFSWLGNHFLMRFDIDGSLDTTFGINGKIFVPIVAESTSYSQIKVQNDNKILISGMQRINNDKTTGFAMMRYNPEGSIDITFGVNGLVFTDINNNTDSSKVVEIQNDFKILLAGKALSNFGTTNLALVRYLTEGEIDTTFGTNGLAQYNIGTIINNIPSQSIVFDLKFQNDGKIILGLYVGGGLPNICILRLNQNGFIDFSFGTNGIKILDLYSNTHSTIFINSNNEIFVAGSQAESSTLSKIALIKLNELGNFDTSFGVNGKVITSLGLTASFEFLSDIKLQNDGKILCSGLTDVNGSWDFLLARFNPNGSFDTTFDNDGFKILDFESNSIDFSTTLLVQSDGKFVCGGASSINSISSTALARFTYENLATSKFSKSNFSVVPNPFSDKINLSFTSKENQVLDIDLYDTNGRKIQNLVSQKQFYSGENQLKLDLPETLSKGIYFLNINDGKQTKSIKIVK